MKKTNIANSVKGFPYISSATGRVAPDLLKYTTVRRSAVDREDLKSYWKSETKATFLKVIDKAVIYKFFKVFINHT